MENELTMSTAPLIVMDANVEVNTMEAVLGLARKYNKPGKYHKRYLQALHE